MASSNTGVAQSGIDSNLSPPNPSTTGINPPAEQSPGPVSKGKVHDHILRAKHLYWPRLFTVVGFLCTLAVWICVSRKVPLEHSTDPRVLALKKSLDDYFESFWVTYVVLYCGESFFDFTIGLDGKALHFKRMLDLLAVWALWVKILVDVYTSYKPQTASDLQTSLFRQQ